MYSLESEQVGISAIGKNEKGEARVKISKEEKNLLLCQIEGLPAVRHDLISFSP